MQHVTFVNDKIYYRINSGPWHELTHDLKFTGRTSRKLPKSQMTDRP